MIINDKFLQQIQNIGVNSYEAKIWTALLSRGVSTAGELSDIANVPRSRSYDVLESLEKKGFVVMKIGKPIKYIAIPPKEVLNRVKKQIKDQADKESKRIDSLKDTELLEELEMLHQDGVEKQDPNEVSAHVKGSKIVLDKARQLIKSATKTVIIATDAEDFNLELPHVYRELRKAKDKGIDIKIACRNKSNLEELPRLKQIASVKNLPIKARFWAVDGEQVLFSITGSHKNQFENAISINTKFFAKAMEDLFKKAWHTQ